MAKQQSRGPGSRRWRVPGAQILIAVPILLGVLLFLYPSAASWLNQIEQSRVTGNALEQIDRPPNGDDAYRARQLGLAHAYNDALTSGAVLEAGSTIPQGEGGPAAETFRYEDLLTIKGTDVMGRLRYDTLGIDLPIRHGTGDAALEHGAGHLEGTSLPVGGIGTRAVLTSHRGLPEATLFTDLDRAEIGDRFTISAMDQTLSYDVVDIQVIDPSETETIWADPERDLVTLITCTPLGVNSHRIVVTGERVTPTPEGDVVAARQAPTSPGFPWWAVALGATFIALSVYIWRSGRVNATQSAVGRQVSSTDTPVTPVKT